VHGIVCIALFGEIYIPITSGLSLRGMKFGDHIFWELSSLNRNSLGDSFLTTGLRVNYILRRFLRADGNGSNFMPNVMMSETVAWRRPCSAGTVTNLNVATISPDFDTV
jgi:hypothetical protein